MKVLIAEDDVIERFIIKAFLSPYSDCDTVSDGSEAVKAFNLAQEKQIPYDLICMDMMMPNMDGQTALKLIRQIEAEKEIKESKTVKVIMITSLDDGFMRSYSKVGSTSYIIKPVQKEKLINEIRIFGLIQEI